MPERLKYLALGVLFVNVSIGGTLTSFAAPPVLMVAAPGTGTAPSCWPFGWKAAMAVLVNATVATVRAAAPSAPATPPRPSAAAAACRCWSCWSTSRFLAGVVLLAHHPVAFLALFLLFLGFTQAYERHQSPLISRKRCWSASSWPAWWCWAACRAGGCSRSSPAWSRWPCFSARSALTAITDNAALTYLGSLIPGMSDGRSTCWWPARSPAAA